MVEPDDVKAAWQRFDGKLSLDLLVDLQVPIASTS
jgi:hypothetical protein